MKQVSGQFTLCERLVCSRRDQGKLAAIGRVDKLWPRLGSMLLPGGIVTSNRCRRTFPLMKSRVSKDLTFGSCLIDMAAFALSRCKSVEALEDNSFGDEGRGGSKDDSTSIEGDFVGQTSDTAIPTRKLPCPRHDEFELPVNKENPAPKSGARLSGRSPSTWKRGSGGNNPVSNHQY